ncbi:potassium-transporting ATPase subunit KdpC [Janibacter melonis]|uniref:potassium-transporting ATPase subunit KdpC n=1 Tax=Janibacter melonis TaxID=262209 RepID=UPI0017856C07|nr:potassium-transporting ATPase subunit KdpC [Janibacter melonis]
MPLLARGTARTLWVATLALLLLTLVLGLGYTGAVTAAAQLVVPGRADGSLVHDRDDRVVGSSLLGQSFTDAVGAALPGYFQSRPSAAGDGYDGRASGGSNLGPEDPGLVATIRERRAEVAEREGVSPSAVPADAVTASASGLDPHISPRYAQIQVPRVARERGLPQAEVRRLVAEHTRGRDLGYLGDPAVDVLALNLSLDELEE